MWGAALAAMCATMGRSPVYRDKAASANPVLSAGLLTGLPTDPA